MNRPNIEEIEKQTKRGTGYRRMQDTSLTLIKYIYALEFKVKVKNDLLALFQKKMKES